MTKPQAAEPNINPSQLRDSLLAWYDRYSRDLPWRLKSGKIPDPYRVLLSEIMLQQTTVASVIPYYQAFLARWPTLVDLAAAYLDDVLHAWQGLGYYSRARNLHKCARTVRDDHGGDLPTTEAALRKLPGIGPYTSSAIAAIAFDRAHVPVDGNVERVLARMFGVQEPLPAAKQRLRTIATGLATSRRAGDYAQAIMDLGATVCTPRNPSCLVCPWRWGCRGNDLGVAKDLPRRAPKPERPVRFAATFIITAADGALFLERRPEDGLLGGLMQVPLSPWCDQELSMEAAVRAAPISAKWCQLAGTVHHGFTHFAVRFSLFSGRAKRSDRRLRNGIWSAPGQLGEHALPTMVKKIISHAAADGAINAEALSSMRPR